MTTSITRLSQAATILALALGSCSQGRVQLTESCSLFPEVHYAIIRDDNNNLFRSIDVKLYRRVEDSILESITHEIVSKENIQYLRTFILFYLADMEGDNPAWALCEASPGKIIVNKNPSSTLTAAIRDINFGPTEAEIVEAIAQLRGELPELELRFGGLYPSIVANQQNRIHELEEMLARRAMEHKN